MLMEENEDFSDSDNSILTDKASFLSSCTSLTKTMLGTGILSMPSVFATIGYLPGIALLLTAMILSAIGQFLLVLAAKASNKDGDVSILDCCEHIHPYISLLFDLAIALKSMGVSASYLIVIGDSMVELIHNHSPYGILQNRILWISLAMLIIVPLSLKRSMDALRKTSIAGVFVTIYLVIIAAINFLKHGSSPSIDLINSSSWNNLINSFAVFVFGFTCHQNVFPVYNESRDKSNMYMLRVITASTGFTAAIYLPFTLLSYFSFGRESQGNIFNNYEKTWIVNIGRGLLTLLAAFTIPLQMIPFRKSVIDMMSVIGIRTDREQSEKTVTLIALTTAYLISIMVVDLKSVIAIIGHSAGIPVCYFLPSVLYLLINQDGKILFKSLAYMLMSIGIVSEWTTF